MFLSLNSETKTDHLKSIVCLQEHVTWSWEQDVLLQPFNYKFFVGSTGYESSKVLSSKSETILQFIT